MQEKQKENEPMLLLNKLIITIVLSTQLLAFTTKDTPLLNPAESARNLSLANITHADKDFNVMLNNPAAIVGKKGMAMQAQELLGIDYSSIIFVNTYKGVYYGLHYTGSSITNLQRTSMESEKVIKSTTDLPYEYHALSFGTSKRFAYIDFGLGLRQKQLILDNQTNTTTEGFAGIQTNSLGALTIAISIKNVPINYDDKKINTLQHDKTCITAALKYKLSTQTSLYTGFVQDKSQFNKIASFHYSIEHYINEWIPIRAGLDHNRYTFGTGIFLDPFAIDIGWAQSKDVNIEDTLVFGFSYGL
jgi:hypothetical protein